MSPLLPPFPFPPFVFQLSEGRSKRRKRQVVVDDGHEMTPPDIVPKAAIKLLSSRKEYNLVSNGSPSALLCFMFFERYRV